MVQSGRPAAAAVVAAPVQKGWLAKDAGLCPAAVSRVLMMEVEKQMSLRQITMSGWKE